MFVQGHPWSKWEKEKVMWQVCKDKLSIAYICEVNNWATFCGFYTEWYYCKSVQFLCDCWASCLGLPVQHRLAEEAYIFCCCTFFLYFFFFARTYRWESAHQAAAVTAPTVEPPALLIKYPQTSDPCCPPFLQGSKMCQISAQISTPVIFGPPYFLTDALYRKTKTNLSRTDDRSTNTPNLGWVGPPTPRAVGALGTPKGKSGKFLIYPPFQRPTPSIAPPMLYHLLGPWLL